MSIRSLAAVSIVAGVGLATLAPSAEAAGGWLVPTTMAGPGIPARAPDVAVASTGAAIVAWQVTAANSEFIQAAVRPPGGAFAAPVTLGLAGGIGSAQAAMDQVGNAIVVWPDSTAGHIAASFHTAGGGFTAPVDLSAGTPGSDPQAAMNQAGDAIAVWTALKGGAATVQATTRSAGGAFSPPVDVSPPGNGTYFLPRVAINSAGAAIVTWQDRRAGKGVQMQASIRPAGGAFSAPVNVSARKSGRLPVPAIDDKANAIVVWTVIGGARFKVRAAVRKAGQRFAKPVNIAKVSNTAEPTPQIAMDRRGNAVIAWRNGHKVEAVVRRLRGTLSALATLDRHAADYPRVAMNPTGDAIVVWDSKRNGSGTVRASRRPAGGKFSKAAKLASRGDNPVIAMSILGSALVAWDLKSAGGSIVQSAARP